MPVKNTRCRTYLDELSATLAKQHEQSWLLFVRAQDP